MDKKVRGGLGVYYQSFSFPQPFPSEVCNFVLTVKSSQTFQSMKNKETAVYRINKSGKKYSNSK